MAVIPDGIYRIAFTNEQLLTTLEPRPGAPLVLLPPDAGLPHEWQVRAADDDTCTISLPELPAFVSYDGEPDMHEMAILLPEPRSWRLIPGVEPDTYAISVPDAPMRLGLSLLRIFPPRIALAPDYGDPYQAWTFKNVG